MNGIHEKVRSTVFLTFFSFSTITIQHGYQMVRFLALNGVLLTSTETTFLEFCNFYGVETGLAVQAINTVLEFRKVPGEEKSGRRPGDRLCFESWQDVLRMLGNTIAIYYSRLREGGLPKPELQAHSAWKNKRWADELLQFEKSFLQMRHRSAVHVVNGIERFLLLLNKGQLSVLETHVPVTDRLFFTFFFVISSLNMEKELNVEAVLSECRKVDVEPIKRETRECVLAPDKLRGYVLDCNMDRATDLLAKCVSFQAQLRDLERAHCCFKLSYKFLDSNKVEELTVGMCLSYEALSAAYRAMSSGCRKTSVPGVKTWLQKEENRFVRWREDAFHSAQGPFVDFMAPCATFRSDPEIRRHWASGIPNDILQMMEALSRGARECAYELAQVVDLKAYEMGNSGYSWWENSFFLLLATPLTQVDFDKKDEDEGENGLFLEDFDLFEN